jgi:hypothetical protein
VIVVCIIFWLIFSIIGVQLFAGKFHKCVYENLTRLSKEDEELVMNKSDCLNKSLIWHNSKINFDNTMNGYLGKYFCFDLCCFDFFIQRIFKLYYKLLHIKDGLK